MKFKYIAAFIGTSILPATLLLPATASAEAEVTTKGGLKVTSGDYQFKFGGRIMYDYNKSEKNGVTDEDGFDIRRARLYVSGNVAQDWSFKAQFNTNGEGVEDMYLRYTGWGKRANVTIGNQKVPFGLEEMTSSKDITVLERSAISEQFAVGRAESVQLHGVLGGNATYAVSAFAQDQAESNDDEIGFAARYTIAPIQTESQLLHFAVAYHDIADTDAFGVEVAAVSGPFHIQAEYADGNFDSGDLSGYYVQAGYIFTGESRPYKGGIFKRVAPMDKHGAWEALVRYEDGDGNYSDIELGRTDATAVTVGLNYYANNNVKIGINYTDGDDNLSADDGNELRVRFQLTF